MAVLGGLFLIVGGRAIGWHHWRGGLSGLLAILGLVEVMVGLRAVREEWSWRAVGEASLGLSMVVVALILADTWRWLAAGAWMVAVIVTMKKAWPPPQED